jgi:uncharacterized protein YcbK (DUF882 family)
MRRSFLLLGTAALVTLIVPRDAHAAVRRITLRHASSGARFDGVWHDGRAPDRGAMRELSEALADPGANPWRPFDPDAIAVLWEVARRARLGGILDIHSGYRTPAVNRAAHGADNSAHLRAMAVDLGVPAGRLAAAAEAARSLRKGGVGIYRRRGFIHLDSGPVRSWSDTPVRARGPRREALSRIAAALRRGATRR